MILQRLERLHCQYVMPDCAGLPALLLPRCVSHPIAVPLLVRQVTGVRPLVRRVLKAPIDSKYVALCEPDR